MEHTSNNIHRYCPGKTNIKMDLHRLDTGTPGQAGDLVSRSPSPFKTANNPVYHVTTTPDDIDANNPGRIIIDEKSCNFKQQFKMYLAMCLNDPEYCDVFKARNPALLNALLLSNKKLSGENLNEIETLELKHISNMKLNINEVWEETLHTNCAVRFFDDHPEERPNVTPSFIDSADDTKAEI